MKTSRRKFAQLLGVSVLGPVGKSSLWERAESELAQSGEVSAELTRMLLDLQGPRGIYDDPEAFASLRVSLARAIPEHKAIRDFVVSMDVEPLMFFKR